MKKRIFSFLLIAILLLSVSGCGDDDEPGGDNGGGDADFWDADGNGTPDWQEEEVTITYCSWQHTDMETVTIESEMIEAFMTEYPNITVEIIPGATDWEWQDNMLNLFEAHTAENPTFPDVFLIRRLESDLPYGWLADLSSYYDNDPDSDYIFTSLQNSGIFNGKRYAVPTYIYPQFWIVNLDILADNGITAPSYNWTWDQMEAIAAQVNNETDHIIGLYGMSGVYGTEGGAYTYFNELPKVLKKAADATTASTWTAKGFDGTKFNYTDEVFQQAMNKMTAAINAGWLKTGLTAEQKLDWYGDSEYDLTVNGKVAIWRQESWNFKDDIASLEYNWDIYPGPSGVTGGNTDIMGMSNLCQHKQAAYQLLKWMSYGEEGILSRFEIFTESGNELYQQANNYPFPVADYGMDSSGVNKIWDNIPYETTAAGLGSSAYLEALRGGAILMNKEVVGWDAADYAIETYMNDVYSGATTYAAVKATIQEAATTEFERTRNALLALMGD